MVFVVKYSRSYWNKINIFKLAVKTFSFSQVSLKRKNQNVFVDNFIDKFLNQTEFGGSI